MIRLQRVAPAADVQQHLAGQTAAIVLKPADEQAAEADRRWANLSTARRQRLREILSSFSSGLQRCMYCEDSMGTDIDHFDPKSRNPGLAFTWQNMLLACSHCNSNAKRQAFPLDPAGHPLLIDPTVDDPADHLGFSPSTGKLVGVSPRGTKSAEVFGLDRDVCVKGRLDAWTVFGVLVPAYLQLKVDGEHARAAKLLQAVTNHPFQSVRSYAVRLADSGDPSDLLPPGVLEALQTCPELN